MTKPLSKDAPSDPLDVVRDALDGLKYGEIVLVVHEGEIVQIARTEKLRTARPHR